MTAESIADLTGLAQAAALLLSLQKLICTVRDGEDPLLSGVGLSSSSPLHMSVSHVA